MLIANRKSDVNQIDVDAHRFLCYRRRGQAKEHQHDRRCTSQSLPDTHSINKRKGSYSRTQKFYPDWMVGHYDTTCRSMYPCGMTRSCRCLKMPKIQTACASRKARLGTKRIAVPPSNTACHSPTAGNSVAIAKPAATKFLRSRIKT